MIEELDIRGVGGIVEARLTFSGDFIVITGESGTGKSSLVRALEFIAGRRAQLNHIHTLNDSCEVQAVMSSEDIPGLFEKYQPQEGTLIAKRSFSRSGKGRCALQEQTVPLSTLICAMEPNIVIQSQFAQLGLLEPTKQLELVDSCGGTNLKTALNKLETTFATALATEREIMAHKKRRRESENRFEEAPAVIRQIKALELKPESDKEWEKELAAIEKAESDYRALKLLSERMTNSEGGLLDQLEAAAKSLYAFASDDEGPWRETIEKTLSGAQELSNLIAQACRERASEEDSEAATERLEKKIGLLRKMKRSLNINSTEALLDFAKEAESELAWMSASRAELDELEERARRLRREISSLAIEVRALRKEAARVLSAKVNDELAGLGMEYAHFNIEIEELDKMRATGAENAIFTLALPDQRPLPVGKNASGGELSRILIALQLSVGNDKLPGTLVFDEVEAGLGGKTALFAGYKLRHLSRRCRTILITHQATIAAMADQHYVVKREEENTTINEVTGEAREKEIARMLSGDESSREALEHAKALLENSTETPVAGG